MKIPSDTKWTQLNSGDMLGVLHESCNINLDKKGEVSLTGKAISLIDSTTTDFGTPLSIVYFDGNYHIVTNDKVFAGDLTSAAFAVVASSPTLGNVSDGIVCFDRLYVSDTTALAYLDTGGSWTTGIGSLTSSFPHPLCVFDALTTFKLAVGDGTQVKTYDSTGAANSTVLTLPSNHTVTSIVYSNGYLYVGTKEINGGEGSVFLWNGSGTNAQYKLDVGATWVYSLTQYRGNVAGVTNEGEIFAISGTSITQLATFPIFHATGAQWDTGNATLGHVTSRGVVALGDKLYININGRVNGGTQLPEMKTGVWCFDPQYGLYHFASPTTDKIVTDSGITESGDVITTSTTHNIRLGDAVTFPTISGLTGITEDIVYYAIPVATTTLKIAASRADAFAGNNITIGGTATTDALRYAPNTQFGHPIGEEAGAIALTNYLDTPDAIFTSNILFAGQIKNSAGTLTDVLCILSDRYNEGNFVVQKVYTPNVTSVWKTLTTFFSGVYGSTEKIITKYLPKERLSLPTRSFSGTWATTTTINTTDTGAKNILEIGDEIEFLENYGSGRNSIIEDIVETASTVSITVSDAYGVVGGTSLFRVNGFKLVKEITSTRERDSMSSANLDKKNNWVQVKQELRGFKPTIAMYELTNSSDKPAQ